jgi:hypothetical protein
MKNDWMRILAFESAKFVGEATQSGGQAWSRVESSYDYAHRSGDRRHLRLSVGKDRDEEWDAVRRNAFLCEEPACSASSSG